MSDTERSDDASGPFDDAIEALLAGRSPRGMTESLSDQEQRMLRMAQLLRGSHVEPPDELAVARIRQHVFGRRTVSRRGAFLTGVGALAAGLIGGIGLDRLGRGGPSRSAMPLVNGNGRWVRVATLADLPHGSIRAFDTGALQGFLIHRNGQVRALSRICTHMGCRLNFEADEQAFVCPCHGAEFNLHGNLRYGAYRTGQLPPLPVVRTRINGNSIEVWTA
jgi:cytochrome b6-f complex iron-sulfur subunit